MSWHTAVRLSCEAVIGRDQNQGATAEGQSYGANITQLDGLLHGDETTLYGDEAYWKEADRQQWTRDGGVYRINRRGKRTPCWDGINRRRSNVRARCEHVFHVVKRLWGSANVRYRGFTKNTARAMTTFALATCIWCGTNWRLKARSVGARGAGGARHRQTAVNRAIDARYGHVTHHKTSFVHLMHHPQKWRSPVLRFLRATEGGMTLPS